MSEPYYADTDPYRTARRRRKILEVLFNSVIIGAFIAGIGLCALGSAKCGAYSDRLRREREEQEVSTYVGPITGGMAFCTAKKHDAGCILIVRQGIWTCAGDQCTQLLPFPAPTPRTAEAE